MEVAQGYKYRYPGGVSNKVPFTMTKPEGEEKRLDLQARLQRQAKQPQQASQPPQHTSLRDYTNITVLSGPPNPPKVEIYLRKASRRCPG